MQRGHQLLEQRNCPEEQSGRFRPFPAAEEIAAIAGDLHCGFGDA